MEITGKLIQIANASEGTSQRGPWRKAVVVFETEGEHPKKIAVEYWNSQLNEVDNIPLGTTCKAKFDVESREWNGKWYTNCRGFGIEIVDVSASSDQGIQPNSNFDTTLPPLDQQPGIDEQDDLPF